MLSVSPSSVSFNLVQGEGFTGLRGRVAKNRSTFVQLRKHVLCPFLKEHSSLLFLKNNFKN